MKDFLLNSCYFLFRFLFFFIFFIYVYLYSIDITYSTMPALNFSNSYSFNEKILFMKNYEQQPEIIAVGSSMTLNNLHSEELIKNTYTKNYLNTASWGSSMGDNFYFIKKLNAVYKPKAIVIVSNITDFNKVQKQVDYEWVESYLKSEYYQIIKKAIENLDKEYYKRNFEYAKKVRVCRNDYECLDYDEYGTLNFDTTNFIIQDYRWKGKYFDKMPIELQYSYLDSISRYCKEKNIKFLFFNSPLRENLWKEDKGNKKSIQQSHIVKIKIIVEKYGHVFVDSSEKDWNDSLFVDAIHFNEYGAKQFTEYCFSKIEK